MQVKMTYVLDKTIDEELDYSKALDGALTMVNILKATSDMPDELKDFDYDIVDDTETMTSEYTFKLTIDPKALNTQEIRGLLIDMIGGR
jgi:hypothetical protein